MLRPPTPNRLQARTLRSQALQHSNNRQRSRSRLVTALEVASRSTSQDSHKQASNALVVDVEQSCLRPLVVQNSCSESAKSLTDMTSRNLMRMKRDCVHIIKKKPLPSYQPAFTAPRRAVGRALMEACLNCSRPFVYTAPISALPCVFTMQGVWNAYRVSERKHGMSYSRSEKKWMLCGGHFDCAGKVSRPVDLRRLISGHL
jgi:hypothetical protein